jgi:hypothetical protein
VLAVLAASGGCRFHVGVPVATLATASEGWTLPDASLPPTRTNERFDWCRQILGSGMALRCGVFSMDPINTVEIDVYSLSDRPSRVRLHLASAAESTAPGWKYRTADGRGRWNPGRAYRWGTDGEWIDLPERGTVTISVPSVEIFGHYPPKAGDSVSLECTVESGGDRETVTGRFVIADVSKSVTLVSGH